MPTRTGIGSLVVLAAALVVGGCATAPTSSAKAAALDDDVHDPPDDAPAERDFGVEVLSVHPTAKGHMLDFRYRVVDAERAAPLFVRKVKPVLIEDATGVELRVPTPATTGPLRSSNTPLEGRTYFMLFANPGRRVRAGSAVTVVIGDFRAPLVVTLEPRRAPIDEAAASSPP